MFLTLNGQVVDDPSIQELVGSRDFLLREGLFETLRVYSGVAFRLDEHVARLRASAERLGIGVPLGLADLVLAEVARANVGGLSNALLRITLSRQAVQNQGTPTLITQIDPLPVIEPSWYTDGIQVKVAADRRDELAPDAGMKTTALLASIMELRAKQAQAEVDDVIFLDSEGHACEGSASNIFLCIDNVLLTPPFTCGALPGITRAAVLGIAESLDITVSSSNHIDRSELHAAFEVFLTSSVREVVPVVSVDGLPVGSGVPGPLTKTIIQEYERMTRCKS